MKYSLLISLTCLTAVACSTSEGTVLNEPIHYQVVANLDAMKEQENRILAYYNGWERETGLNLPSSSFSIIVIHPDKNAYENSLTITMPEVWGSPIGDQKSLFHKRNNEDLKRVILGSNPKTVTSDFDAPADRGIGQTKLLVIHDRTGDNAPIIREYSIPARDQRDIKPFNLAIVCDVSSSTGFAACNHQELDIAYGYFIREAVESGGGSFSIWKIGNGRKNAELIYYIGLPKKSPGEQMALLMSQRKSIGEFDFGTEKRPMSAIVQALGLAAENLRERNGDRVIFLLSDGRQVDLTTGLNLERSIPSPEYFLKIINQAGQQPNLSEIEVMMFGLGSHIGNSSADDNGLFKCWEFLFKNSGARRFSIYRSGMSKLQSIIEGD